MKFDLYTKSILTVIAICLTINVLKDFDIMPKAYANEEFIGYYCEKCDEIYCGSI